jgi:hypothetical protein
MSAVSTCAKMGEETEPEGGIVDDVYIRLMDGSSIRFRVREFDINVGRASQENKPRRFTYKDTNGREAPIYLRLDQVAAIIVTPAGAGNQG